MNDLIATLLALPVLGPYLPYISAVVAIAAAIAPWLPAPANPVSLYAVLYRLVNLAAVNVGHARNATDPAAPLFQKTPPPASATILAFVLPLILLSACTADGSLKPGVATALAVACQVDAIGQPVLVQLAPAVAPQVTAIAAVDQQLVHPAVQQACAAVNGKPKAVAPAAGSVP